MKGMMCGHLWQYKGHGWNYQHNSVSLIMVKNHVIIVKQRKQ